MSAVQHQQGFEQWRRQYNAESRRSLAAREDDHASTSRSALRADGYVAAGRYSDLLPYGYQIVAWLSPRLLGLGEPAVIYEYCPVNHGKQRVGFDRVRRRMTARTLEQQLQVHAAIGVPSQLELAL